MTQPKCNSRSVYSRDSCVLCRISFWASSASSLRGNSRSSLLSPRVYLNSTSSYLAHHSCFRRKGEAIRPFYLETHMHASLFLMPSCSEGRTIPPVALNPGELPPQFLPLFSILPHILSAAILAYKYA